jgi:RNA polymerase sigma-70 factor (ECF subfamily)
VAQNVPLTAIDGSRRELDELTLRRAQRSEPAACRALVECYGERVFALLGRMLGAGRRDVCEDLAQDTFVDVFRALEAFSPLGPARLSSWILCIASRRAVDRLRRERLEPVPYTEEQLAAHLRSDDSPVLRARARAVQAAVQSLEPDHRAILLLRDVHGLEYAEIARALKIEIGTVKSRLFRAREAVKAALARQS